METELFDVQITVQTPFPGTPLYSRLKREGRLLREEAWEMCTLFDINFRPAADDARGAEARFHRPGRCDSTAHELTERRRANFEELYRELRVTPDREEVFHESNATHRSLVPHRCPLRRCPGRSFLLAPGPVFQWANVTPPNHWAYVQFPAALLIIFALMFVAIARDPVAQPEPDHLWILLKVSYCGIASWYWFTAGIPGLWKPFAVIDLAMAGLFVWSFRALGERSGGASRGTERRE